MNQYNNRRKFLIQSRNLVYGGLASWLCGCVGAFSQDSDRLASRLPNNSSDDKQQIIVIGAGIAGITAAKKLQAEGYHVVVLEGRDRIGGRIWTDNSLGVPLDLGAAWIHKVGGNPLSPLVKQFGINTVKSDYDSQWNYQGVNQLLDEVEERRINLAFQTFIEMVNKLKDETPLSKSISLEEVAQQVIQAKQIEGITLKGFRARLASTVESEMGDNLTNLGIRGFNEDSEFTGADVVFPQGYTQLVQALATDLDIRINHLVQKIAYDDMGVEVTTNRGVFKGARVIVTVPLGVLKHGSIEFSPVLPQDKLTAVEQLGMGALNKLVLKFPKQFWASEPHSMAYINGDRDRQSSDRYIDFWNWQKYIKQPILVALVSGNFSRALSQMSQSEATQNIMMDLQAMFGKDISPPIATLLTQWHNDPFAYGSYTTFAPRASFEDCDRLANPVGDRLFFAGEATYGRYLGTVHGALLSGEREANRIAKIDKLG